MKLFDAHWAPNPRKVHIFLTEKEIEIERVTLDLRKGEQLQPGFLAVNPRGLLPALLLDDGTVIDESVAICRYLEMLCPEPNLFGRDARETALIESWTRRIDSDCYAAVVYVFRNSLPALQDRAVAGKWPPMPQISELVTRGRTMFETFAEAADAQLGRHAFIACDRYSFADITLRAAIDFGKGVGLVPSEGLTHLARWQAEMEKRAKTAA